MSYKKSGKQTADAGQKMMGFLNRIRQKLMPDTITGATLPISRTAFNEALQEYARQQGITNFTVESGLNLQQQIRAYERAIENRRQMLLDMAQTNVSAVKGKNFTVQQQRATDVSLPYEPQAVNWDKIAKRLSNAKAATGVGDAKTPPKDIRKKKKMPVHRSTSSSGTISRTLAKVEDIWMSLVSDDDGYDDEYFDDDEDLTVEPKTKPATSTSASPSSKSTPKTGEGSSRSSRSSSSSSSESSVRERGRWANIVVAIVADVKKLKNTNKLAEASKDLTAEDLMILSREQGKLFDRLMVENTKQSLFLTQPTKEEVRLWNNKNEARKPKFPEIPKINFQETTVEFKPFCLECYPRHRSDYPHFKNVVD